MSSATERFVDELRKLKARSGLSYRGIERAARRRGDVLPASTVATALNRASLPSADLVRALVRACGGSDEDIVAWTRVHQSASELSATRAAVAEPADAHDDRLLEISPTSPCLLPPRPPRLVGRGRDSEQVESMLTGSREDPTVVIITGPAGVGKTTFAVHTAYKVRERYPDGQLYAHLRGAGGSPAESAVVIGGFLRALGVAGGAIPSDYIERLNLYRTLTARRRMLIVLDDAAEVSQIRNLIPTGEGCAVIITSRASLASLDGSRRLLAPLSTDDAVGLLADMVGRERVSGQIEVAKAIVDRCDCLPLAVWIAGARLAARPHLSLSSLADALGDAQRQLDTLAVGEVAVRASLQLTYEGLPDEARRLLRLLSLTPNDFDSWVAAALLDTTLDRAEGRLDELLEVHLLDADKDTRYRMHDLVRAFASERHACEDSAAERDHARERMLGAALQLCVVGDSLLSADFQGHAGHPLAYWRLAGHDVDRLLASPLDWFDRERRFLVMLAEDGLDGSTRRLAAYLATSLTTFFQVRCFFDDWHRLQTAALDAATATGDARAATTLHRCLGELATIVDRYDEAAAHFERALHLASPDEDPGYIASSLAGLAFIYRLTGRYNDASEYFERAMALAERTNNRNCLVYATNGLGTTAMERGDAATAQRLFERALELSRQSSYRPGIAQALRSLGMIRRLAGDYRGAAECFEKAGKVSLELGDRVAEAHAACWLGDVLVHDGHTARGRDILMRALWIYREFNNSWGEAATLVCLADAELAVANADAALVRALRAMEIWWRIASPYWLAYGLTILGRAYAACGDRAQAARAADTAARLRSNGIRAADTAVAEGVAQPVDAGRPATPG